MIVEGEPRSVAEMVFVVGLHPCEGCQGRDVASLELHELGSELVLTGPCPRCRTPREVRFRPQRDPRTRPRPPRLELGGPEPSQVIRPVQLVADLDRLGPAVDWKPELLAPAVWRSNGRIMDRAARCLIELLKFIPADADAIPDAALDDAGRADRRARPERYDRGWLTAERDRYLALIDRSVAQAARIWSLDAIEPPPEADR
jgi:hypothetical protein